MRRLTTFLAATTLLIGGAALTPAQAAGPSENVATQYESTDKIGDAEGPNARARLASDIRKVRYSAPDTPAGEMTVVVKFVKLWNGQRAGAPRQQFVTYFQRPGDEQRVYALTANNKTGKVVIYDLNGENLRRITPETASLKRTFRRGGAFTVRLSTEWLRMKQANVFTTAQSGWGFDEVRRARLDVSGDSGQTPGTGPTPPARR